MACDNSNFLVNQINTESLDTSNFLLSSYGPAADAYGNPFVSAGTIYVKANLDKNIHFMDPKLTMPCALINSPSTVELNSSSYSYETDPNRTVIATVAAEDFAISVWSRNAGNPVAVATVVTGGNFTRAEKSLLSYVSPIFAGTFGSSNTQNDSMSDLFTPISPKAAHPYFAGVPVKSNVYTYGPWINYPSIDGGDQSPAGVEVKVMDDFAPWNYGGMVNLDFVANQEIYSSIQYDQIIEMGSVSSPGLPAHSLGGNYGGDYTYAIENPIPTMTMSGNTYNVIRLESTPPSGDLGPVITNMSVNINSSSIGTTYNFRTYARKLGFFNKEAQDAVRSNAKRFLQLQKQNAELSSRTSSSDLKNSQLYEKSLKTKQERAVSGAEANLYKSKFFATSPGVALAGYTKVFLAEREASSGSSGSGSVDRNVSAINTYEDAQKAYRMKTFVGLYPLNEIPANVSHKYPSMSVMSLDGIFSPVSFYPTAGSSTFAMTPYHRKNCPHCGGDGILGNMSIKQKLSDTTATSVSMQCPYCYEKYPVSSKSSKTLNSADSNSGGETLPPYVLTNNNDISNLATLATDSSASASSSASDSNSKAGLNIPVNLETLQPIVVPEGIMSNTNSKSSEDKNRHCIEIVANNMSYPAKLGTSIGLNRKKRNKRDMNYTSYSPMGSMDGGNNQRFFGLRGPLTMHAWGYDIDGYPVPNASDEPHYDDSGRPLRFKAKIEVASTVKYDKLKPGDAFIIASATLPDPVDFTIDYLIKNPNDDAQESEYNGVDVKKLKISNDLTDAGAYNYGGDIITKQYTRSGENWIKGDRSTKFLVNFSEQADKWPVGPIDLRWDYNRKVWTVPANNPIIYKMVYVILEEDLLIDNADTTYAARGRIDDIEYISDTLEEGYRRLVYVKDRSGYTAPRGTKLFCKYMPSTGFYEPINKPVIVATGVISGNQATISQTYARGNTGTAPTITVAFSNPIGFNVAANSNGIFTFINGGWVLTAAKQENAE
jgi:hypothetical protein